MRGKMTVKITTAAACLLVASCGLFSEDKIKLDGERISVLDTDTKLRPDYRPGAFKVVLPRPHTNKSWSQSGGNSVHRMEHLQTGSQLKGFWESSFGTGNSGRDFLISEPIIAYKVAFAIDADATVSAYRLDSGERIWKQRLKPLVKEDKSTALKGVGLAEYKRKIYATTGFGGVFALDMTTGKKIWFYNAEMPIRIAPTVANDKVLIQTIDNTLIALNAASGEEEWRYKSAMEQTTLVGGASPAYDPAQDLIVAAFSNGELRAFKGSTGSPLWSDWLAAHARTNSLANINAIKANPVIAGNMVFAAGHNDILVAIDVRTGTRIWERDIGSTNQPWVAGKMLFVLSTNNDLLAMEAETGKIVWSTKIPLGTSSDDKTGVFLSGPVLADNRLLVATSSGYAFAVSPYTGRIMSFVALDDGVEVSPVVADGITLLTTNDAELVAYK
ncbi:MAG: PQQ-binding-like beta-propeller repeat protein [Alphaproteobacteria bacterium]|nr:PQQ-binding-like beta-propeller repeat protein [Alphaproteobacteria bacterium]